MIAKHLRNILFIVVLLQNTVFIFGQNYDSTATLVNVVTPLSPNDSLLYKLQNSNIFKNHHFGFSLYDPSSQQTLCAIQSDKYFVPASNAKVLTLYTALSVLTDEITGLRYQVKGDTLIFWGTGDPSFLNQNTPYNSRIIDFLNSRSEKLFFSSRNFMDDPYGEGWMWDDYDSRFQPEKSPFPIYGNLMTVKAKSSNNEIGVLPSYFNQLIKDVSNQGYSSPPIKRQLGDNTIEYNRLTLPYSGVQKKIPFRCSDSLIVALLQDTLHRPVGIWQSGDTPYPSLPEVYSQQTNNLLKEMMQESDNFIAEQLLLLCSDKLFYNIKAEKTIDYAQRLLLYDLPDEVVWSDGSGLSRYNMMTPRSMVRLLEKIYYRVGQERTINLFAAGGQSGTIKDRYRNPSGRNPYVYAKTGTLAHVHCLSGYVFTKSGKMLIFSFMHNNFKNGLSSIKDEMEKTLLLIYNLY